MINVTIQAQSEAASKEMRGGDGMEMPTTENARFARTGHSGNTRLPWSAAAAFNLAAAQPPDAPSAAAAP